MSGRISQPVGQVRFTNVAMVRYKKAGKKFEVAAYRNKVLAWRNGTEKDIYEVLQASNVFTNASKGVVANKKELLEAFGTEDHIAAAQIVLEKGEVEVTDKERGAMIEALNRDVASIVADKCVNPSTQRPYPLSLIITALKDAHFSVNLGKSAKQQALKAIEALSAHIPIERAKMRVRINVPSTDEAEVRAYLTSVKVRVAEPEAADATATTATSTSSLEAVIDPGLFRDIEEQLGSLAGGRAVMEVLTLSAVADPDMDGREHREPAAGAGRAEADTATSLAARIATAATIAADSTAASAKGTGMNVTRVTVPGRKLNCNTCGLAFDKAEEHREHFRSDHHRYNLKMKMKGKEPIAAEAFDVLSTAERDAVLNDYE